MVLSLHPEYGEAINSAMGWGDQCKSICQFLGKTVLATDSWLNVRRFYVLQLLAMSNISLLSLVTNLKTHSMYNVWGSQGQT